MEVENGNEKGILVQLTRTRHAIDAFREPDVMWVRVPGQPELVGWEVSEDWRIIKEIVHLASLNRELRGSAPRSNAALPTRANRSDAMDGPEKDHERRLRDESRPRGLPEERNKQDGVEHQEAGCLAGSTDLSRAPSHRGRCAGLRRGWDEHSAGFAHPARA